jgi:hypothetical protein
MDPSICQRASWLRRSVLVGQSRTWGCGWLSSAVACVCRWYAASGCRVQGDTRMAGTTVMWRCIQMRYSAAPCAELHAPRCPVGTQAACRLDCAGPSQGQQEGSSACRAPSGQEGGQGEAAARPQQRTSRASPGGRGRWCWPPQPVGDGAGLLQLLISGDVCHCCLTAEQPAFCMHLQHAML